MRFRWIPLSVPNHIWGSVFLLLHHYYHHHHRRRLSLYILADRKLLQTQKGFFSIKGSLLNESYLKLIFFSPPQKIRTNHHSLCQKRDMKKFKRFLRICFRNIKQNLAALPNENFSFMNFECKCEFYSEKVPLP